VNDPGPPDPELERVARRLGDERPQLEAGFGDDLRRRLVRSRAAARGRARLAVAAYAGCGLVLLAIAAVGLAGAGPFAAG
jgi:type VI protein secretion system component VasF